MIAKTKPINIEGRWKMTKKIFVYVNGCIPNRLEAKKIREFYVNQGYTLVDSYEQADLIVFNTCAYSGEKISGTLKFIEKFQKSSELIVSGCLPKIDEKALRNVFDGEIAEYSDFGFDFLYTSGCVLGEWMLTQPDLYHLITSVGCLGSCSYCAIPRARGKIRSKPLVEVVAEFKEGLGHGFEKFLLWGDDLGAYGQDISESLPKLLSEILSSRKQRVSLYLWRLGANWFLHYYTELEEVLKTGRIKGLHISIQSGSNRLLKLMNRTYEIEPVRKSLKDLKEKFPDLRLAVTLLVGFPGETNKDFEETLNLVKEGVFDAAMPLIYSDVPGTPASKMKGKVSDKVKEERQTAIREIVSNPSLLE